MQKGKSTNLHDFEHELFLGFIAQQPLPKAEYQVSYVGGYPLWLLEPNPKLLVCQQCTQEQLTFLGQIFCPLDAQHTYNRIMYMFFCEKCRRSFRCLKQQTSHNFQPKPIQLKNYKVLTQQSFQIQSDPLQRKQLLKLINRAKIQVQQQIIMEQQGENDQQLEGGQQVVTVEKFTGQEMMSKLEELEKAKKNREYSEKEIDDINRKFEALKLEEKEEKQGKEGENRELANNKKDHMFEQYVRVVKSLNNPMMIYSNIPLPYNKLPLNPRHHCKHCQNKLQLQIQITQKILLFHKNLAVFDWGSIFIYTCVASCPQSQQECVVVQYELDAISQEEIAKLKKTKKTRRKNKNKSLSKEKNRLEGDIKNKDRMIDPQLVKSNLPEGEDDDEDDGEGNMVEKQDIKEKQQEGDWD